ncbi:RNA polymerase sigma-54 factor [Halanaerobium kushneri]|uniref:RNA polymerase sigma-54 factor n=1 Tax=Halanaerobium kushneri TaxID=56779 RepID=A0A1N6WS94_9FIRM|nr:RNA polymerase sigma-54 factor [Halanaerobium kushneri]
MNENEIEAGKFIIGSFNEKGKLTLELEVIAELFSFSLAEIEEIYNKIKTLDIDFTELNSLENKVDYVDPYIVVKKADNKYKIIYKEKFSPTLKINNYYYNLLKNSEDQEC